jgi:cyclohexanone monooxygenase
MEATTVGFTLAPGLLNVISRQATEHLRRQLADSDLRERVTPTFRPGCKRILWSNTYYPVLNRENVELVTDRISRVSPGAIITADGCERQIDTLIVATGFHATDNPAADRIEGPDGRTLGEQWREFGQQAYKGTSIAGFPNMFTLVGPNTGTGNMSMIYMIESQLNYLVSALRAMERHHLATVEVRAAPQNRYNTVLQQRMRRTVWASGCSSWYLDAHGRNTTIWPNFAFVFRRITRHFDLHAYRVTTARSTSDDDLPIHPATTKADGSASRRERVST